MPEDFIAYEPKETDPFDRCPNCGAKLIPIYDGKELMCPNGEDALNPCPALDGEEGKS